MKKTHDYIHHYRGYWSDGGKCRIQIYQEAEGAPVVICSQLPDNENTSVTNMAEYLAAEVRPGGRKNAYSGMCAECAGEEGS